MISQSPFSACSHVWFLLGWLHQPDMGQSVPPSSSPSIPFLVLSHGTPLGTKNAFAHELPCSTPEPIFIPSSLALCLRATPWIQVSCGRPFLVVSLLCAGLSSGVVGVLVFPPLTSRVVFPFFGSLSRLSVFLGLDYNTGLSIPSRAFHTLLPTPLLSPKQMPLGSESASQYTGCLLVRRAGSPAFKGLVLSSSSLGLSTCIKI